MMVNLLSKQMAFRILNRETKMKIWYEIDVKCNEYSEITRQADPSDRWEQDDLAYYNTPIGFTARVFDGDYVQWATSVPFEPKFDKDYYLLVVYYGNGDSFHNESGLMHVVDLYRTREEARVAEKQIWDHRNNSDPDYEKCHSVNITFSDGVTRPTSTYDWTGYFNDLERTEIFALRRLPH